MSAAVASTPAPVAAAAPAAPAAAAPAPAAAPAAAAPAATSTAATGSGNAPAKTSLYVGDLNTDVTEGQLFDIFSAIGPVSTVRVCRHAVTRESLGYAYVNFQSAADAERAVTELNYSSIKGRPCRIMWSQRDPSLRRTNVGNVFVKNLGPAVTSQALHETCKIFGTILSCKVATDPKGASKGYGFVHFEGEEAAKKCIEVLNGMEWAERVVEAKPYVPRAQRAGPEWNNLYVKNLPQHLCESEKTLNELFAPFGEIVSSKLVTDPATGKPLGFGFVCFKEHKSALDAEKELNGKEIEGVPATLPPKVAARLEKAKTAGDVPDKNGDVPSKDDAAVAKKDDASASEIPEKKAADPDSTDKSGASSGAGAAADAAAAASAPRKLRLFVGRAQKKSERERALREQRELARRERVARFAGCNLYVRNLDESVDDETLKREFGAFGTITSAMVARDPSDPTTGALGRSKLFGYVCFSTPEEASKAIAGMHKRLLANKPLYVQLWQSKDQRAAAVASSQRVVGGGRGGPNAGGNNMAAAAAGLNASLLQAQSNPLAAMMSGAGAANPLAAMMGSLANPMLAAAMAAAAGSAGPNAAGGAGGAAGAANPQGLLAAMQGAMAMNAGRAGPNAAAAAQQQAQQQQQLLMFLAYLQQMQLMTQVQQQQQQQAPHHAAQQQRQAQQQAAAAVVMQQQAAAMQAQAQAQAVAVAQQQQAQAQRAPGAPVGVAAGLPQQMVVAAGAQQPRGVVVAPQAAAVVAGQQQQQAGRRGGQQQPQQAAAQQQQRPATAAAAPAGNAGRAVPGTPGAPTAAAVAAGTAKATPAQQQPAKAGAAGAAGKAGAAAPAATAYNAVARNVDVAAPAAPAAAANAAAATSASAAFTSQLASATPDQRKNMIGERLYGLISVKQGPRAGKITGMLLEGMDEGELLHLLESPADLDDRIHEALEVLAQAAPAAK